MKSFMIFALLLFPLLAFAEYELAVVKTVSSSGRTFVTQHGHQDGIVEGQKVSFTTDNISMLVRAKTVTYDYTVWEVVEDGAKAPFKKDDIILLNKTTTYTEVMERSEKIHQVEIKENVKTYRYLKARGGIGKGISQSVTGVANELSPSIENYQVNILYQQSFFNNFDIGLGLRVENEINTTTPIEIQSNRGLLIGEILYNFPDLIGPFDTFMYTAATIGIGTSKTRVSNTTQEGNAYLLPALKFGLRHDYSRTWSLEIELGAEALYVKEKLPDDNYQTTTQINGISFIGLRYRL